MRWVERRPSHPQRLEHQALRHGVKGFAGQPLERTLQEEISLTGVAEALARPEMRPQRLFRGPPVRKSGRVAQDMRNGYADGERISRREVLQFGQGSVE